MLYAPFISQYDRSSVLSYVSQFPNQCFNQFFLMFLNQHFNQFSQAFPNQGYNNNNNQQLQGNAKDTPAAPPAVMLNQLTLSALRTHLLLRAPQSTVNLHLYYNNNHDSEYYQNCEPNHQFRPL